MNRKINNLKRKLNKIRKNKNKQLRNVRFKVNRNNKIISNKVNRIRNINKRYRRNRMPAAIISSFRKQFNILKQTGTSMRVHGRDLIYKIPDVIANNSGDVMTIIPCNPAYWTGTRMSAIASGYQNYRPLLFKVTYVPQCAVTQQGNVLAGTLWAMTPNNENLQQTLRTSNGGMLVQCYKAHTANVKLGNNLQFNLFRMGGKFDQESNPFIFIAIAIGTYNQNEIKINPGYFYIEYEYELKNPIGNTIKYYNSGLIQNSNAETGYINETLINCFNDQNINLGAVIQKDDQKYFWNDTEVNIANDRMVWYFSNDVAENVLINLNVTLGQLIPLHSEPTIQANSSDYFIIELINNEIVLIKLTNLTTNNLLYDADNLISTFGTIYKLDEDEFNDIINNYNFFIITENKTQNFNQQTYIANQKFIITEQQ